MNVWVLLAVDYDFTEIVGVFLTEEKAESIKLELELNSSKQGYKPFDYDIELCEVE